MSWKSHRLIRGSYRWYFCFSGAIINYKILSISGCEQTITHSIVLEGLKQLILIGIIYTGCWTGSLWMVLINYIPKVECYIRISLRFICNLHAIYLLFERPLSLEGSIWSPSAGVVIYIQWYPSIPSDFSNWLYCRIMTSFHHVFKLTSDTEHCNCSILKPYSYFLFVIRYFNCNGGYPLKTYNEFRRCFELIDAKAIHWEEKDDNCETEKNRFSQIPKSCHSKFITMFNV